MPCTMSASAIVSENTKFALSLPRCIAPDHFLSITVYPSDTYTTVSGSFMSTQLSDSERDVSDEIQVVNVVQAVVSITARA